MIKEFFSVDKAAPEKIHLDITDKDLNNRSDLYDTILRAITASFHRLFGTKELYKISIDIRLEKRMINKKEVKEVEDEKTEERISIEAEKTGNVESPAKDFKGNKYHAGYDLANKKE